MNVKSRLKSEKKSTPSKRERGGGGGGGGGGRGQRGRPRERSVPNNCVLNAIRKKHLTFFRLLKSRRSQHKWNPLRPLTVISRHHNTSENPLTYLKVYTFISPPFSFVQQHSTQSTPSRAQISKPWTWRHWCFVSTCTLVSRRKKTGSQPSPPQYTSLTTIHKRSVTDEKGFAKVNIYWWSQTL